MRYFWLWRLLGFETLAAAAHWSVRRGYFQVEDFLWVNLSGWKSLLDSFHGSWGYGTAYRPITRLTYWLDYLAFQDWAPGWHFTNVALHGLNAALLALLLERFGLRRLAATAAALLFVVAPLTAECVAFISDRTAIVCFLFMQLAALAWLSALGRPRPVNIAAMLSCALLGAMSYEAGFILPGVLLCLFPFALRRSPLPRAIGLLTLIAVALALLLAIRSSFLGMLTTTIDGQHADPITALAVNGPKIGVLFVTSFGAVPLIGLALMTLAALAQGRLRLPALAALALSLFFYLPYVMVDGVGDRFFYMTMAPVCVLAVLALDRLGRIGGAVAIAAAVAAFLPGFFAETRSTSIAVSKAGAETAVLRRNIVHDLPDDSTPNIIDDIPFHRDYRPLFGDFFEMAILDSVKPRGPWAVRTDYAEKSPIILYDLLNRSTHFWLFDAASQHLTPITKRAWRTRHPEVPALFASIGPDASGASPKDCALTSPSAADLNKASASADPSNIYMKMATASGDGIVTMPLNFGGGAFGFAVRNDDSVQHRFTGSTSTGAVALPLSLVMCETNPATGFCLSPATSTIKTMIEPATRRTYSVFVTACAEIPLDEARNRIFVEFADEEGGTVHSASVAARTIPREFDD